MSPIPPEQFKAWRGAHCQKFKRLTHLDAFLAGYAARAKDMRSAIRAACPACDNGNVPSGMPGSDEPAWEECQYCGELLAVLAAFPHIRALSPSPTPSEVKSDE